MSHRRMSPGMLLGNRYRLEDLVAEVDAARLWRATDTILARDVRIQAVAEDDPRAPAMLTAARTSVRVDDPRLLQVLDCVEGDGLAWVVTEWDDGTSLATLLEAGPLAPDQAAWIGREVAETLTHAHAVGLTHGELAPENIWVSNAGSVRVAGFMVNATLSPPRELPAHMHGPAADLWDAASVLYAGLTARWPGLSPSAVPPPPIGTDDLPLRPRQVRAGIPRGLDRICDQALRHHDANTFGLRTAVELAAALSDYIGDPALLSPAADPAAPADPAVAGPARPDYAAALSTEVLDAIATGAVTDDEDDLPDTAASSIIFDDDVDGPARPPAHLPTTAPTATEPADWSAPAPPPPPTLSPGEAATPHVISGPLFAEHDRRVPAAHPNAHANVHGGSALGDDFWPFDTDATPPPPVGRRGSRGTRVVVTCVFLAAVLVAIMVAFDLGKLM